MTAPGMTAPGRTRVAAIDCGTNSLRLLVADLDLAAGRLTDVDRRMEIVRLGQGVDATGRLAPEALDRTLHALAGYAKIIKAASADAVRMVATSATRDAANAADFVRGVERVLGVLPAVLSGEDEAYLSFTGATAELTAPAGPYLVVDIGGGSTEFVLGDGQSAGQPPGQRAGQPAARAVQPAGQSVGQPAARAGQSAGRSAGRGAGQPASRPAGQSPGQPAARAGLHARSVDIGCVRLTERHLHSDPPSRAEIAAAGADIEAALDTVAAAMPAATARTLVGLAGSVTTVAGLALGLAEYDPSRIHHARISAAQVAEQTQRLLGQTRAQRAALGVMHPGRVDVIGGGAMVLDHVMRRFGFAEVLVSEHDILDGIAWSLAAAR